ncbi:hypothetical protein [Pseudomonas phage ANB1]|nr:hypothetical protein [Pseudomonas phage ANB1]
MLNISNPSLITYISSTSIKSVITSTVVLFELDLI